MDYYSNFEIYVIVAVVFLLIAILYYILKSPFHYPYYIHYFDVSGKRNPDFDDLIDNFLISNRLQDIKIHNQHILAWKKDCKKKIEKSIIKKYREKQFQKCLDDKNAYQFHLTRKQTRYRQKNYVRTAYKVTQTIESYDCNYSYLYHRNEKLKEIDYECTLREYHSKNQRRLMTKELRRKIMVRDHYTCQICGKYMPDEVGLHIDHIIPVSKGGKTVPSNLQVLCSKCNGNKSNKS